jgi:hypothetical protein
MLLLLTTLAALVAGGCALNPMQQVKYFNQTLTTIEGENFTTSAGPDRGPKTPGGGPGLLTQGVPGVPQDPLAPRPGPLGSHPVIGKVP